MRYRRALSVNRLQAFEPIMTVLLAFLLASELLFAPLVHLNGFGQLLGRLPAACLAAFLYCYCRWRRFRRFEDILVLSMFAIFVANVVSALVEIAARTSSPLIDGSLAHIDRSLGLSTGGVVLWISRFPWIRAFFSISYDLLPVMVMAALFLPVLCGRVQDSQLYTMRTFIAALITAALFARWPAVGPWSNYGFAPTPAQAAADSYLHLLKSSPVVRIDFAKSSIVSFPSFHVVLALLSTLALWGLRRIRWVAALLCAAICASTVTTGWHYFIDIVGGVAVTAAASTAVKLILRCFANWQTGQEFAAASPQSTPESEAA